MSVRPPPAPLFVHFGIEGGATCSHIVENWLFVGSMNGKVRMLGLDSNLLEKIVYEDDEKRKIQSINSAGDTLFVHIRASSIIFIKRPENIREPWVRYQSVEIDHVGFCNFLVSKNELVYCSSEISKQILCWTSENRSKENVLNLDSEVTPMFMELLYKSEEKTENLLIGLEDGKIVECRKECDGNFEKFSEINIGSKEPIFCLASCSKWVGVGCAKSPIFLIPGDDLKSSPKTIHYPQTSSGCSSLAFSPNSKQLLGGFWDGSIRVFSCARLTVLLHLSSVHNATITSLIWRPGNEEKGEEELVIATSLDGTASKWKLR